MELHQNAQEGSLAGSSTSRTTRTITNALSTMCNSECYPNSIKLPLSLNCAPHVLTLKEEAKRPRVSFCLPQDEKPFDVPKIKERSRKLWYSQSEIMIFKLKAKAEILKGKQTSEDTSGFERFDATRSKYKKSALHYVLMSQKVKRDPDFQRYISLRCTSWAKLLALNQGFEDFCKVYDPLSSLFGDDTQNSYKELFFDDMTGMKRSLSEFLPQGDKAIRNVRQRTMPGAA